MKISNKISLVVAGAIMLMASGTLAAGDAAKGKKLVAKCKVCHTLNEGGKNKLGPNLFGVLNQPAGQVKGYKYSKALKASGVVWDAATFADFIGNPRKVIKRTKMSFRGLKKASQRADLLAYFETLQGLDEKKMPAGDAVAGKKSAAKYCAVCHTFEKGGKVLFGPNLFDMVGKPAGAIAGYKYSAAMKKSGLVWTDRNIVGFLANPEQFLKGTIARFAGLKTAKLKADILAYMKTLK